MTYKPTRKKRQMTQEEVAELMHTHKPVVSRLESGNSDIQHFASLLTLAKFALAVGYQLKFGLTPIKYPLKLKKK